MQHLYLLRTLSGLGLRLGLSGGLLVGSAGLAAVTALLYTAAQDATSGHLALGASLPVTGTHLATRPADRPTAPLGQFVSAALDGPRYSWVAGALPARRSAASVLPYSAASQEADPNQLSSVPTSTVKATMQRSWHTIKLAFR